MNYNETMVKAMQIFSGIPSQTTDQNQRIKDEARVYNSSNLVANHVSKSLAGQEYKDSFTLYSETINEVNKIIENQSNINYLSNIEHLENCIKGLRNQLSEALESNCKLEEDKKILKYKLSIFANPAPEKLTLYDQEAKDFCTFTTNVIQHKNGRYMVTCTLEEYNNYLKNSKKY